MFSYIPKSHWFPTSIDFKDAPTIDELLKLCKAGEVERVIIPMTYYGYGASLVDDSNKRSIERHYKRARFQTHGYALTMSAQQFIRNADYRELVEELQEQYPIFDEQDYSELENETKLEHIVDEISYVLINEDVQAEWIPETLYETKDAVRAILEDYRSDDNIDWWDFVEIDSDGASPYATEENISTLVEMVKTKASKETK